MLIRAKSLNWSWEKAIQYKTSRILVAEGCSQAPVLEMLYAASSCAGSCDIVSISESMLWHGRMRVCIRNLACIWNSYYLGANRIGSPANNHSSSLQEDFSCPPNIFSSLLSGNTAFHHPHRAERTSPTGHPCRHR